MHCTKNTLVLRLENLQRELKVKHLDCSSHISLNICRWHQQVTHVWATEMCENVFPLHLKHTDLVCLCSREWSPCLWPEIQTSPTGCRGSYQSQQTSTCQLHLFSDCSHLFVVYGPSDMSKGADRNMTDAYATFSCPRVDTSGDSRAHWVTL